MTHLLEVEVDLEAYAQDGFVSPRIEKQIYAPLRALKAQKQAVKVSWVPIYGLAPGDLPFRLERAGKCSNPKTKHPNSVSLENWSQLDNDFK